MARLISRASSLQVGLFMPPSVSRLAGEGGCCGEVPAAYGSSGRPLGAGKEAPAAGAVVVVVRVRGAVWHH